MSELPGTASIVQRHVNPEVEKEFCFQTIYGVAEHICHQLLLSSDIPHFIESPAHDRHSLHKLPKNCHGTGSILQYPTPNNTGDQHSSSCDVRIILHYMRDQPKIKSLLQEAFKIENESRHPGILGSAQEKTNDRGASERDTPGSVSFYRVCVKKERLQMHLSAQAGTAITIQVRNILDDISARYEGRRQSSNALSVSEGQRIARFLYSGLEIVGSVEQELHEKEFRRNKKDNELLEESDKIANCFRKILGPKTGEARNIRSSSFEALASFLKLNGNNTRARLVTLIGSHNLNIPDEIQQEYQHMDFNIVLYLIDQELLGHETPSAPKESAEQVRIIMSTILWLNLLFPPRTWQERLFKQHSHYYFKRHLAWLGSDRQRRFLEEGDDRWSDDDLVTLDILWELFHTHEERPIQLGFGMACHGMLRDLLREREDLCGIIEKIEEERRPVADLVDCFMQGSL